MASAGIDSLVVTVRKKAKFKQLAMFSIQAITNATKSPFRDWELNLEEAIQHEAVEALVMVLKLHPGHPGIFRDVTDCLTALVTDSREVADLAAEAAQRVAAEGGVQAAIESMNVDKTYMLNEVGDKLFGFLKLQAMHAPESVLHGGGAKFCLEQMLSCDAWALVDCFGTMEALFGADGSGAIRLAADGAVGFTLQILEKLHKTQVSGQREALESGMSFFVKFCANPAVHATIHESDGVDRVVSIVDERFDNKVLLKLGGQMLGFIAAQDDAAKAGEKLASAWSEDKQAAMEKAAMMIAQMAMERGKAEAIVSGGGIPALVACIHKQATPKTLQASARALARLATAKKGDYVQRIVKEKALKPLCEALSSKVEKMDSSAAALTMALSALATSSSVVEKIHKESGVESVIQALASHPDSLEHTQQALKFFEALAAAEFNMDFIIDNGGVSAVLGGMSEHGHSAAVQRDGTRALLFMATDEENVQSLVDNEVVPPALLNLSAFPENPDVHHNTLFLLSSIALVEENVPMLQSSGALGAVSSSLRLHPTNVEVRAGARDTLQLVASAEDVRGYVEELAAIHAALANGDGADSEDITRLSHTVGALSVVHDYALSIVSAGAIASVAAILNALSAQPASPELEESMAAATYALTEMSKAATGVGWQASQVVQIVTEAAVVTSVVSAMKGHPTMTEYVAQAAAAFQSLADIDGCAEHVVEAGAIEACVYAMRANGGDGRVLTSCSLALLQLAKIAKISPEVAARGATRQLLLSLEEVSGRKGYAPVVEEMLNVLETVALSEAGRDAIGQQGGVGVVGGVMDKYELCTEKGAPAVVDACQHVLQAIALSDVVNAQLGSTVASMGAFSSQLAGGAFDLGEVLAAIDQIGAVAMVGSLSEDGDEAKYLLQLINMATQMGDGAEKSAIISRGVRALGRMGGALAEEDLSAACAIALGLCRGDYGEVGSAALADAVRALDSLASGGGAHAAALLVEAGAVEVVGALLAANKDKSGATEVATAAACFGALSALCDVTIEGGSEAGALRAYSAEVIDSATVWLATNGADAKLSPEALYKAVDCLAAISTAGADGGFANAVFTSGAVQSVMNALETHCASADSPNVKVMQAAAALLDAISAHGGLVAPMLEMGVARAVEIAGEAPEYAADADAMRGILTFLDNCVKVGGEPAADQLAARGAKDVVLAAMSAHPFDEELLSLAAGALLKLEAGLGQAPHEALDAAVAELTELYSVLADAPDDADLLEELKGALQAVNNRLLVPGALTQAQADTLLPFLVGVSQALLKASKGEGEEAVAAATALASCVQAIGRVASTEGVTADLAGSGAVVAVVRALAEQPDALAETAIHCLGRFALNGDAATVKALSEAGAVACIGKALQGSRTRATAQLRGIAFNSMQKIREALQANAAAMVGEEGGSDIVYQILCATAFDASSLTECIEAICIEDGGSSALLEVMSSGEGNFGVQAEVVKALHQRSAKTGVELKVMNVKQMSGIVRTLQGAIRIAKGTDGNSTKAQVAESAIVTAGSLAILNDATADSSTALLLVEGGGVEGIVQVINDCAGDEATLVQCVQVLCNLAAHESETLTTKLAEAGVAKALLAATRSQPQSAELAELTVKLLNFMTQVAGVNAAGLDREAMLMVMKLIELHPENQVVQSYGPALLAAIQEGLGGDAASLAVKYAIDSIAAAAKWSAVWDDGQQRHYYYNGETQETQWDQPAEYGAMVESIQGLETGVVYDGMEDRQVVEAVTTATAQHGSSNVEVVKSVIRILSRMTMDGGALTKLSEAPGAINSIVGLLQANNANPHDHADMVEPCLALLEKMGANKTFKDFAAAAGALTVIVQCIMANMHLENIVLGCTNILVALTTGNKINIESAVQSGAIATVQSVAQSYPSVLSMLDAVLRCLGNLMGGGDEYKAAICAECGDEVLNIIRRLPHEASTLKMALRCIGNLATDDNNILTIVRQQATQAIVNSMKYQIADTVFIQMAMEVIGNFASFEAPEDCEGDPDDIEASIYHIISEEGGAQGVVDSMRANLQNASLLVAGMDALGNLANDPASCDGIVQDGAVQLIVDIMQVGHRSQPAHPRARTRARADTHTHTRAAPTPHPPRPFPRSRTTGTRSSSTALCGCSPSSPRRRAVSRPPPSTTACRCCCWP